MTITSNTSARDIPQGVLNMICDRALYERAVALSIFEKGCGRIERKMPDGNWQITDWRERPEVIALSDAPEVKARIEEMKESWIKKADHYRTQKAVAAATTIPDSGKPAAVIGRKPRVKKVSDSAK
jgi:hypothetical protein